MSKEFLVIITEDDVSKVQQLIKNQKISLISQSKNITDLSIKLFCEGELNNLDNLLSRTEGWKNKNSTKRGIDLLA